jgi:SAM-dependent methyltransferase
MTNALRVIAKQVIDPILYRVDPHYAFHRARRDWDRRAQAVPKETTATFDAADWGQYWASGYRDRDLLLGVAREAGPLGKEVAVEIGCGLGRITRPLAEHFGHVLGVDISPAMLKQARAQAASPNIRYEPVGADQHLPLPDGAADLVIAWTVFRHVSKSVFARYLNESHRVLRSTGCLVFEAQVRETGMNMEPASYDSLTEREYSRAELAEYGTSHGFRWAAERTTASVAPGTVTLTMAWRRGQP